MTPEAAGAAVDMARRVVVIGTGEMAAGIVAQVRAATGWSVYAIRTLVNTKDDPAYTSARLWVLAGDAVDDPQRALLDARGLHPGADVVLVLHPGATVLDRCLLWERGAAAVLEEPVLPREVLACLRGVWARRVYR